MPISNTVGQVVRGDDFFARPREVQLLWDALESGSHVLMAAPRRIGKSSLVEHMRDNPQGNFHLLYIPVESVEDEEDFFKKMYAELFLENATYGAMMLETTKTLLAQIKKVALPGGAGFEVDTTKQNWYEKCVSYLVRIGQAKEFEEFRLVIVLDEFPQTVENIRKKHGDYPAVRFLQINRDLRHTPALYRKVQFIYTGSTGLEHVVGKLHASRTINDLHRVVIGPMSADEAWLMVHEIISHPSYRIPVRWFSPEIIEHILHKIQWFIPYYIQLLLREMAKRTDLFGNSVTVESIDLVFEDMMKDRHLFEHLVERLGKVLTREEFAYVEAILNRLAQEGTILTLGQCYEISVAHKLGNVFRAILNLLEYDGYIVEERGTYRFVSSVVQSWWRNNVVY